MANQFTYQVIKDTTEHAVIKLTGKFDGSGEEDNVSRIQANTLSGALNANTVPGLLVNGGEPLPYYGLSVNRIWYDCVNPQNADVELYWNAEVPATIMLVSGTYEYDGAGNWVTIPNASKDTPGCNGDIGIRTRGMASNTSYTIVMELRKHNEYYQRGQFNDPAAFNYPPYNIRP